MLERPASAISAEIAGLRPDVIALNEVCVPLQTARLLRDFAIAATGIPYKLVQQTRVNGLSYHQAQPRMTRSRASGSTAFSCSIRRLASLRSSSIQGPCEAAGDLALRFREVRTIGVEPVGPEMRAAFGIDQLRVHPNLITSSPYAAFEDVVNTELAADLLHVDRLAIAAIAGYRPAARVSEKRRRVSQSTVPFCRRMKVQAVALVTALL